jgi:hypothetical protein
MTLAVCPHQSSDLAFRVNQAAVMEVRVFYL